VVVWIDAVTQAALGEKTESGLLDALANYRRINFYQPITDSAGLIPHHRPAKHHCSTSPRGNRALPRRHFRLPFFVSHSYETVCDLWYIASRYRILADPRSHFSTSNYYNENKFRNHLLWCSQANRTQENK
jgi:hypothetical protein